MMQLTDQITSADDLVWTETRDQMTGQITGYETRPAPGLWGSIKSIYVGYSVNNETTPAYQYRAHAGGQKTGDIVYDLPSAKQGVYNALWLLSMAAKPGKIKL